MTVVRKHDSHQGCVKGFRKVCHLMDRCDSHGGMQGDEGRGDNFQDE